MGRFIKGLLIIGALVVFSVFIVGNFYLELQWFKVLGYDSIFVKALLSKWGIRVVTFLVFFIFTFLNLYMARRRIKEVLEKKKDEDKVIDIKATKKIEIASKLNLFLAGISAIISLFFTSAAGNYWLEFQMFLNKSSFNIADPLFNNDIGFYVFQLPIYQFLYQMLFLMVGVSLVLCFIAYFLSNPITRVNKNWNFIPDGQKHISLLLSLVFLIKAWGYRLDMYNLLFSPRGVAFGASYTDVFAVLPGLRILMIITIILSVMVLANMFIKKPKLIAATLAILILASFSLGQIYPAFIQRFRVEPNEFAREEEFIEKNIEFTNKAFGLDRIKREQFPVENTLTTEDIEANIGTFGNIRLWDYRPIQQTFAQLQELRMYYRFRDVDTDRYMIDGEYRQVMLSARELDQANISERAQTWLNTRLQYTHGYGVVMAPVNEVSPQGLPNLFIQDLPPKWVSEDIRLDRPEIYYGEMTDQYVVVNTDVQEFNYPSGDQNVYTTYEGDGGVPISSIVRRILFASRFQDYRLLVSGNISNESKVLFNRNIHDRVRKIAPFISYDNDPYIVVNDGRLFWIQDAYTSTSRYPYSEPTRGINYIRNPIKVVIDAYNGDVSYYLIEPDEPISKTLSNIFPDLFKSFDEMPEGLKSHIRYPEMLFNVQAERYLTYHMSNPRVFYNKEDMWEIPNEVYMGDTRPVEPYYTIMKLPGHDEEEFLLMQPYTPFNRNVMVSWLAARSDGENYGELINYLFPKNQTIYGPSQIEARIDQDSEISQQLSLWSQRGSRVIRGNLLVLPVNNSIIYIEPLYLQAEQSELPELSRVIVAYEDDIVMERSLEEALAKIIKDRVPEIDSGMEIIDDELDTDLDDELREEILTINEIVEKANELFDESQRRLREGDWSGYGRIIDELENILKELEGRIDEIR